MVAEWDGVRVRRLWVQHIGDAQRGETEVGTPNYCAPEVLMRASMDSCYDGKKADGALC